MLSKRIKGMLLAATLVITMVFSSGCGGSSTQSEPGDSQTVMDETEETKNESQDTEETQDGDTGSNTVYPLTITDGLGNEVIIEKEPERVISLTPANTEILFAIGAGDRVKGRTDYCNYPEEAADVVSVGTYSTPNMELIISAEPDIIFSDYLDDSVRAQVEAAGAKVVLFSANSIKDTQETILLMGQILNRNEEAVEVVDSMNAELEEIQILTVAVSNTKSVFVDIGSYYSAGPGSLIGDMLNQIGVINVAADTGTTWPQLSLESIIEKNPDIYFSLYTDPEELKNTPGLDALDCIKNDQIIFYDGLSPEADVINRPGPRLAEGVRILAEDIYPELFQ